MNKLGKIFIALGALLIITSLFIIIINNHEDKTAEKNSSTILKSLKQDIIKPTIEEDKTNTTETKVVNQNNKQTIKIQDNDYIGIITIPTLNIELPIISTYDEEKLKIAPCVYYGKISKNLIICAHSYKSHFGYLSKLNQNDTIIITDINGENYIYEVLEIEVLNSDDIEKMIDTEFDLTLYTCTNDGTKRITIRAKKVTNKNG